MTLPRSPFKGLAYFGESEYDALFFFGRERESELVAANLMASRLTVLYGPSGVGKSSLLRAGVSRRLRSLVAPGAAGDAGSAVVIVDTWRDDPVAAVAAAAGARSDAPLADALAERALAVGGELYLVLDQMEEYVLYHGRDGGPLADALEDVLTRPELPVHVLLGVRDDALADLDAFKRRLPGLFGNLLRLDHLTRAAARAAIEGPLRAYAEAGGTRLTAEEGFIESVLDQVATGQIERGLTGRGLVDDGRSRRVEAPYLQLVLERVWEVEVARGSDALRESTLAELGGAERIVEEHLELALAGLDPGQRDAAARLFNHLVTPSGTKIAHAVDDLARYTDTSEQKLEPLLGVLDTNRIVRRVPGRSGGPPRYEIFHDVLAGAVLAWRTRHEAARALAAAEAEARRRHRRLALVAGLALAALVGTLALAAWALSQRSEAREQARSAEARELAASALTALSVDPERSLRLALRAAELEPSRRTEDVLRRTVVESRLRRAARLPEPAGSVAVTRSGDVLAASPAGIRRLDDRLVERGALAVSGRTVELGSDTAVSVSDRTVSVTDPVTGEEKRRVTLPAGDLALERGGGTVPAPEQLEHVAVDPSANVLAVSDGSRRVVVVDAATGRARYAVELPSAVTALRFGPAGRTLAAGGTDGSVQIHSVADGDHLRTLRLGHVGHVLDIAFSPRATLVATASSDGTARIWRVGDGQPVSVLPGHENFVTDVAFSDDGSFVVTTGRDGTARVWRAENGEAMAVLRGHGDAVTGAAFLPGGGRVATVGADGTLRVWDSVKQPSLRLVRRLDAPVERVDFRRDGIEAVSGGRALTLASDGRTLREAEAGEPPVERAPDGATVTVAGKTAVVRRPDGRELVLRGHRDAVTSARFSADGSRVVTASRDHDAIIWDARSGRLIRKLVAHFAIVSDARFSPNGRWVVTAGPGRAGLWDASTGSLVYFLQGHEGILHSAAFDRTGRRVVTGGADGTVRTYDCRICGGIEELAAIARTRLREAAR